MGDRACLNCGEFKELGTMMGAGRCDDCFRAVAEGRIPGYVPANDGEPGSELAARIAVEQRAAELAAGGYQLNGGKLRSMSWEEGAGWDGWDDDRATFVDEFGVPVDRDSFDVGWLAHAIVAHDACAECGGMPTTGYCPRCDGEGKEVR